MVVKKEKEKSAKRRSVLQNKKKPSTNNTNGDVCLDYGEMITRFEENIKHMCMINKITCQPSLKIYSPQQETPKKENVRQSPRLKKPKDEKATAIADVDVDSLSGIAFPPESMQTSLTTIPAAEYFQPKIEIYPESANRTETILLNSIHIMTKLSHLHFWRVGLTSEQIQTLATFLSTNETISHLTLDGNEPLKEGSLASLIQESSGVKKLQLRYCHLGHQDAKEIADRLGSLTTTNTKLLCLDLTGNKIGDTGADYLARALRTNRCLLTLSLCGNGITDAGCIALATVLSQYFLTHEEIVYRRNFESLRMEKVSSASSQSSSALRKTKLDASKESSSGATKKKDRSSRSRGPKESDTKEDKPAGKGKKAEKISPKKAPTDDGSQKAGASTASKNVSRSGSRSVKGAKTPEPEKSEVQSDSEEAVNPLLQKATYVDPEGLRITGNFVLAFLNLARNQITEKGLKNILEMLEFQSERFALGQAEVSGTGLMKVILWGNNFASDCETINSIYELISTRDPLRKRTPSPETETQTSELTQNAA